MGYSDIYDKGAGLLYAIYGKLGSKAFFDAVKGYVIKFKYDFVTTEKFKEYWHSMADVGEIIDAYLSVPAQSAPECGIKDTNVRTMNDMQPEAAQRTRTRLNQIEWVYSEHCAVFGCLIIGTGFIRKNSN